MAAHPCLRILVFWHIRRCLAGQYLATETVKFVPECLSWDFSSTATFVILPLLMPFIGYEVLGIQCCWNPVPQARLAAPTERFTLTNPEIQTSCHTLSYNKCYRNNSHSVVIIVIAYLPFCITGRRVPLQREYWAAFSVLPKSSDWMLPSGRCCSAQSMEYKRGNGKWKKNPWQIESLFKISEYGFPEANNCSFSYQWKNYWVCDQPLLRIQQVLSLTCYL